MVQPPNLFWLSGFTFPNGFLTAVLQSSARQHNVRVHTATMHIGRNTAYTVMFVIYSLILSSSSSRCLKGFHKPNPVNSVIPQLKTELKNEQNSQLQDVCMSYNSVFAPFTVNYILFHFHSTHNTHVILTSWETHWFSDIHCSAVLVWQTQPAEHSFLF